LQGWDQILNLDPASLLQVILRTLVVYFVVLLLLRAAGKRELGQMTPFDLVVLLLISNAVQNAMVGPDVSLSAGLLAAGALVAVNHLVNRCVSGSRWLQRNVVGTPTLLVNEGEFVTEHLRREGITKDEVLQAAREHGVDKLEDVRMAVLEVDGTISVIPEDGDTHRTRRRIRGRKPAG